MTTTDPIDFIHKVWALQRTDGKAYGVTSQKDWETGAWRDYPTKRIADVDILNGRDIYFCPNLFTKATREVEYALPGRWLYADLDEVEPGSLPRGLRPSLAWETSPGRFQALWLLDRPLRPDRFERLNQRLTYATGADKGGWSASKVLRVPGTVSTKYGSSRGKRFTVRLVAKGGPHRVENLMEMLPKLSAGRKPSVGKIFGQDVGKLPAHGAVVKRWQKSLPARARRLLATRAVVGGDDRSARLWELYNLLLQAGVPPLHVLVLVRKSVWNKYAGQRREVGQLQTEIGKAALKHAQADEMNRLVGAVHGGVLAKDRATGGRVKKKARGKLAKEAAARIESKPETLPYLEYQEFMGMHFPKPEWLVDGFWVKGAYGVCVGEYKAFKSTILLNLAMSVASGLPFLEEPQFQVRDKGLVLYLHEEGRQGGIQDHLHRISMSKGVGPKVSSRAIRPPKDLPLHVTSFAGFKLSDEQSQLQLVNYVDQEKPKLIIMESWYLIASDIDENNAGEVAPVLDWITKISQDFGCAIIISHHYNKDKDTAGKRAIDRISGSGVFGRWFESVIALERKGPEEDYTASIEAHHREQKGVPKQTLAIEIDSEDEDSYNIRLIDNDTEPHVTVSDEVVARRIINTELRGNPKGLKTGTVVNALKKESIVWDYRRLLREVERMGYRNKKRMIGDDEKAQWYILPPEK